MPEIKIQHIVSVSSEDKNYPAENLTKNDGFKKWKCATGEKQAVVVLQFEKAVAVKQIDIGNDGAAFIEVLVGKSTSSDDDYEVILVASSFMSPTEARATQNPNRVRIFGTDQLSQAVIGQKWDRAKVICTQPFNKNVQYGLSFIKFHSSDAGDNAAQTKTGSILGAFKLKTDEESSSIRTGSLFEKSKSLTESSPVTGVAAIRAASKIAEQATVQQHANAASSSKEKNGKSKDNIDNTETKEKINAASSSKEKNGKSKDNIDKTETKEETKESKEKSREKNAQDKARSTNSPPPAKKSRSDETTSSNSVSFDRLMSGVIFTLSGFQNPERSDLRDAAIEMGATFKPDWTKQCTHLVCAFEGTPKYEQVAGHGYIVKKSWITDCHSQKKLLPWRKYRLGRARTPPGGHSDSDTDSVEQKSKNKEPASRKDKDNKEDNKTKQQNELKNKTDDKEPVASTSKQSTDKSAKQSDEEWDPFADDIGIASDCDTEEEIRRFEAMQSHKPTSTSPSSSKVVPSSSASNCVSSSSKANNDVDLYNVSTDEETSSGQNTATDEDGLPVLPDFFSQKIFLLYGKLADRRSVVRYITAYNGRLVDYMSDNVKFVITDSDWDDSFDTALSDNPDIVFVRSSWITACHNLQKCVPHQKFAVVAS